MTCAGDGIIFQCRFRKNKGDGSGLKIKNDFDTRPNNNNDVVLNAKLLSKWSNSILVSKCEFEIDKESEFSIYYIQKGGMQAKVKDCVFTVDLANNAHHIDGVTLGNEMPKLRVQSCKFESDSRGAMNIMYMKISPRGQIFNYDKLDEKLSFKVWVFVISAGVICIALVSATIVKRRNEIIAQDYDISLIAEDVEDDL